MKWEILIATLGQRTDRFLKLLDQLLPQVERANDPVQVTALWNNGERPLSHVRQDLVEYAEGEYINFVDDDDELPDYYVSEVLLHLTGQDYVGWRMQAWWDGQQLKPTYHTLKHHRWWEDTAGYYRDISHLNPIRRELTLQADFRRGDPPEDVSWVEQMRGRVATENYINRIMYLYRFSSEDSTWKPGSVSSSGFIRPQIDHPQFRYHPRSSA